jgi:hypothetical protein
MNKQAIQKKKAKQKDKQAAVEHTFDEYEREILCAIEAGEIDLTPGPIPEKEKLEEAARNTLKKTERITIRLSKPDLQAITYKAALDDMQVGP